MAKISKEQIELHLKLHRQISDHFRTHAYAVMLNDANGERHIRETIHTLIDATLDMNIESIGRIRRNDHNSKT